MRYAIDISRRQCVPNRACSKDIVSCLRLVPYILAIIILKTFVVFVFLQSSNTKEEVRSNDYNLIVEDTDINTQKVEDPHWLTKQTVLLELNSTVIGSSPTNRTPDTQWLFYNRIPRTGGSTLVSLMQSLGEDLDYTHQSHIYQTPWKRLLTEVERKNLAIWYEYNYQPKSYDRYALFINLTHYRSNYIKTRPVYITLLRDPLEKFISDFRKRRSQPEVSRMEIYRRDKIKPGEGRKWYWMTIDDCVLKKDVECRLTRQTESFQMSVPFICGQNERCLKVGDKWALQKAKYHSEYEYSVIGILEHWNMTMSVLEHYVPRFFQGTLQKYWSSDFNEKYEERNIKKYQPPSKKVIEILKNKMSVEYDLYEFVLQRLQRQYNHIRRSNT